MLAQIQTWSTILQLSIAERLAYRGDFVLATAMRFLPIVTQVFLWTAVMGGDAARTLAGYTRDEVVAYYLLTMVARSFSSMPGLASGVARQIRDGQIKKYMVQPIDLTTFALLSRVAHKLVYYGVALGPFAAVFYLCRSFFPPLPGSEVLLAFVVSLGLSFLLGFYLELSLGLLGFWFLEISSLLFIYMLFNFFFSGHMFPLEILPPPWRGVVEAMPLKYLAYFPPAVFLQKIPSGELWREIGVEALWVVAMIGLAHFLMNRGYRRYSGFGG